MEASGQEGQGTTWAVAPTRRRRSQMAVVIMKQRSTGTYASVGIANAGDFIASICGYNVHKGINVTLLC
jgi:hypothetical protein